MKRNGWQYKRKRYFHLPTVTEIKAGKILQQATQDLIFHILTLNHQNTALVLPPLIPNTLPTKFKKHGRSIILADTKDLESISNFSDLDPKTVRENAFEQVSLKPHFGYIYSNTKTGKQVKISLVDCIEAAWIFSYTHQDHPFLPKITVESYTGDEKISSPEREGGQFIVHIPTRGKLVNKKGTTIYPPAHKLELDSIAIKDNEHKIRIAWGLNDRSRHSCTTKGYTALRFPNQSRLCVHDITAVLGIIEQQTQIGNTIPYHTTPIAIPTELTVDFYMKLIDNCLIEADGRLKPLNQTEREIMLWGLVNKLGYEETFNPKGRKLRDYNLHRII